MTAINQAIDRIAIYYASFETPTMLDEAACLWVLSNDRSAAQKGVTITEAKKLLSDETLQKLVSNYYPARLNLEEIKSITKDYPFQLPREIYDLYQRGNGCLPIGLDDSLKDWSSFNNYTSFSLWGDHSFLTLHEAMSAYNNFAYCRENYEYDIDPRWFPISYFEDSVLAVIGSEEQQDVSTVISFYDSDCIPTVEWPSLTNMLFTWIEIREKRLKDSIEIDAVHQKYGRKAGDIYW